MFPKAKNSCKLLYFIVVVGSDSKSKYPWENRDAKLWSVKPKVLTFLSLLSPFSLLNLKSLNMLRKPGASIR